MNEVRQGDPLAPTLFSLYINNIAKHLKENGPTLSLDNLSIDYLLYADDRELIAGGGGGWGCGVWVGVGVWGVCGVCVCVCVCVGGGSNNYKL